MVQWLRLHASKAGGVGSIPGWRSSTYQAMQPKEKKNRFQWTVSCFQSYAVVANQELLISTLFLLNSCELSSKNPVAFHYNA